ncbi:K(+)-transporting ATPase subunit C [Flavobacterium sp. JP2137]|uniref:K(+)-transporting ATPase subunit C n=1 Tax=Flavobacterium sp. JP2137 TaxID=3414510 RepID=UPI003D2FC311
MKKNIISSFLLTLGCFVLLAVIYPLLIWALAQFAPNEGKGEVVRHQGKAYYVNLAQKFESEGYFWSRPSAVDYNTAASGGSNKGATNPEYLAAVEARITAFTRANPQVKRADIPVDLVTASGSGLDPDFSVRAAVVQVARIARHRKLTEQAVLAVIHEQVERPLLGLFGPEKVNVLRLNIALDQLQ